MSKEPKRDEERSRRDEAAAPPPHNPMEPHPNNPAQLNRDNVNPNIPPAEPKVLREQRTQREAMEKAADIGEPEGARIIPPNDGGGIAPTQRERASDHNALPDQFPESINEPPGSNVLPDQPPPDQPPPVNETDPPPEEGREALPPKDELEAMTRAELDELAEQRGVHVTTSMNKSEVIDELRRDARRKR